MPITPKLRNRFLMAVLLCMATGNGIVLWKARFMMGQGYGDFANFYTAGTLVRRGLSSEIYSRAAQWKVQQEFASEVKIRRGPLRYLRPPFQALFFSVFAAWPYPRALLIWTGLQLVLLSSIPLLVVRGSLWKESFPRWTSGLLAVGTFPVFVDLIEGQDAALLAFLFAMSFWQLESDKDMGAGFTLGLTLVKFQFAIPFVVTLWIAGRKRVLPGFAASASIVLAISAALVGWRGLLRYPGYLLAMNRATGIGIAPEIQMTLRGLLTLLVGRAPYPGRIHWVLAPVALGAIVYTGRLWRRAGRRSLAEGFGLATIVAIVTSYYAYDYDLLLLMAPLLAMRAQPDDVPKADRVTRWLEMSGLLLLLLTPVFWFVKLQLHFECLMTLPLLAVAVALARRLKHGAAVAKGERRRLVPETTKV
jgi:hypothetical protein